MSKKPDEKARYFSQTLRQRLGDNICQIILFGSRARGTAREGSDYDFMVVLNNVRPDLRTEIIKTEVDFMNKYDMLSSCLVYDEDGWEKRKTLPIGINILREGVPL